MKFERNLWAMILPTFFLLVGCTDTSDIGIELFDDDTVTIEFSDSIPILASMVMDDSLLVSISGNLTPTRLLVGAYEDQVYGSTKIEWQTHIRPYNAQKADGLQPDVVDSVVLTLIADTIGYYGRDIQQQHIEVFRTMQVIPDDSLYLVDDFGKDGPALGSYNGMVDILGQRDTLIFKSGLSNYDTLLNVAALRIPIDVNFGKEIAGWDSAIYSDTLFREYLKGLNISPTSLSMDGLLSMNTIQSRMTIYYHNDTIDDLQAHFSLTSSPFVLHATHDYSNSSIQSYLDPGYDDVVGVEPFTGISTKLELPDISTTQDLAVNYAQLEIRVADLSTDIDTMIFEPPPLLRLMILNEDGNKIIVSELVSAINNGNNYDIYGGIPIYEDGQTIYRFNISRTLQSMINGEVTNEFYIAPYSRTSLGNKILLDGTSMKLLLNYTEL